jgi:hypothetical protein
MEKASEKIIKLQTEIKEKMSFVVGFIENNKIVETLEGYLKFDKTNNYSDLLRNLENLYAAMELMLFCISELEDTSAKIVESPYTKTLGFTGIINQLDEIAHEFYRMARSNPELEGELEKRLRKAKSVEDSYQTIWRLSSELSN